MVFIWSSMGIYVVAKRLAMKSRLGFTSCTQKILTYNNNLYFNYNNNVPNSIILLVLLYEVGRGKKRKENFCQC